jgi:integrase
MARGPGVSVERQDNGKWRVRWRETVELPDGTQRRPQRSKTVEDESTARQLAGKILRALELGELPEVEAIRQVPEVATVDVILDRWLDGLMAKGASRGTIATYGSFAKRILRNFREIEGLPDQAQVPGTLLCRDGVIRLTLHLREEELADSTVHWVIRALVDAWTWAGDDPETFPGIAPAPRDKSSIVPPEPVYSAAPAPTLAECDAVIRHLAELRLELVPAAVIARCTGLRIGQIVALQVGDVDLRRATLRIRSGKSRREKKGRTVPLAPVLVDYLAPLVRERPDDAPLVARADGTALPDRTPEAVASAWEAAVAAKEARQETWSPDSHGKARPDHAFRAAFQAHLVRRAVRDEIIDILVGHGGKSTRARHYVNDDERWEAMVEAVATLPPLRLAQKEGRVVSLTAR